jgi:Tfp pilus assembly protein PilE
MSTRGFKGSSAHRCRGASLVKLMGSLATAGVVWMTVISSSYGSLGDSAQAQRARTQAELAQIAVLQEQFFLNNGRYTQRLGAEGLNLDRAIAADQQYTLRVDFPTASCPTGYCYVLRAIPKGDQVDECGTLSLGSDGTKLPAGCW